MKYKYEKIETDNYKHDYLHVELESSGKISDVMSLINKFKEEGYFNRKDSGTLIACMNPLNKNISDELKQMCENINKKEDSDIKSWIMIDNTCFVSFK